MDDAQPQPGRSGGDLEPVDRTAVLRSQLRLPAHTRFQLRDPFAEVLHRSNSFDEMVSTANRLGALRFTAIGPDGERTEVRKQNDAWARDNTDPQRVTGLRRERTDHVDKHLPTSTRGVRTDQPSRIEQEQRASRLQVELNQRYVVRHAPLRIGDVTIGQTEYRHRSDSTRLAFTESTFRLRTDSNSPSVVRSMVNVAETRGWQTLRVTGSDDFRRMVWLEASRRNLRTIGYDPVPGDLEALRKQAARPSTSHEHGRERPKEADSKAGKQSARGGSRKAVLAALEAVLVARNVPTSQRDAVMAAAAESLARRVRDGEQFRVKVYDRSAPSQRPTVAASLDPQRSRDRPAPTR